MLQWRPQELLLAAVVLAGVHCSSGRHGPASSDEQTIVDVDIANVTNAHVSTNIRGCHADLGFSSLPSFFSANMVYEPAFGLGTMKVPPWFARGFDGTPRPAARSFVCPTVTDSLAVENGTTVVNRGVGGVGMSFEAGRAYEFEAYCRLQLTHLRASSSSSSADLAPLARTFYAELRDSKSGRVLARHDLNLSSYDPHVYTQRLSFTLVPSASTTCTRIANGSNPLIDCGPAHVGHEGYCLDCGGELVLGVEGEAEVYLGWVGLAPGPWGRVIAKDGTPLPALRRAADLMEAMVRTNSCSLFLEPGMQSFLTQNKS